ncbi:MAG: SDR family oxidoreductase [Nannocystaceae bacterium]|nr:SDR family oxidoreductase [Nannocystaceae bacterium]
MSISMKSEYAGKHVLLTGGTGFVGKVWLVMALTRIPDIGRIYLLMRGKGRSVKDRWLKIVNENPAFRPLHEQHGAGLSKFIADRVEVIQGTLDSANMSIEDSIADRLREKVDLVVNCAGLVDFNPDVRVAVSSNLDGSMHVADFAASCRNAAMIHVSTCYVAGTKEGIIGETIAETAPNGTPIDAEAEYKRLQEIIVETEAENESEETVRTLTDEVVARVKKRGYEPTEKRVAGTVGRLKAKRLRAVMSQAGTDRAKELGWPNTYTYTKALAEMLTKSRYPNLRHTALRPAIVESAMKFPFPGWNEGFNTTGPLIYLASTWLRHIPAKPGNPLDIIPVDLVVNGIFIAGAAVMRGEHAEVYQTGSSDRAVLTIDRLTELSALGNRQHLRKTGTNRVETLVLSRWDAVASDPEHVLNVSNLRELVFQVSRYLRHGRPEKIPSEWKDEAENMAKTADKAQRKLRQIEEVLELFMPFTYDHYMVFESRALEKHTVLEPEFRFSPEEIDWRQYWLECHMPGLRRWCFPSQYENKEIETYTPKVPFVMLEDGAAAASSPQEAR